MNDLDDGRYSRIDPALVFACSLLFSLILSYPTLRGVLDGQVDIVIAGLRYLVALGFSWVALFGLFTLVSGYAQEAEPPESEAPPTVVPDEPHPLRRRDDVLDLSEGTVESPEPEPEPATVPPPAPLGAPATAEDVETTEEDDGAEVGDVGVVSPA